MSAATAAPAGKDPRSSILVTGDVVVDHHMYEGDRLDPGDKLKRGVRRIAESGGVWCLYRLLAALFQDFATTRANDRKEATHEFEIAKLAVNYRRGLGEEPHKPEERKVPEVPEERWFATAGVLPPGLEATPDSYALWRPVPLDRRRNLKDAKPHEIVWRTHGALGYGENPTPALVQATDLPTSRILVLDDANLAFRLAGSSGVWHIPKNRETDPAFIVLKTAAPLARGKLWEQLSLSSDGGPSWLDRTVVVASIDALRADYVRISRGLSWERTIEDVRDALFTSAVLTPLTRARHLVVSFATDGALWLTRQGAAGPPEWRATVVFDSRCAEGEWRESMDGHSTGYLTCLTASIVRGLALHLDSGAPECDLKPAIQAGLAAMRDLHATGHGTMADVTPPSGFPAARLAAVIRGGGSAFQSSPVPWLPPDQITDRGSWSIVEMSQRPLLAAGGTQGLTGLARQSVVRGLRAIESLPHARFGKFVTADRREIETLRNIRRLMWSYRDTTDAARPLSIGVFGPPGAGKSFAVRQLANDVFGEKAWMEFNLSQFAGSQDFIGALHQVRDRVLSGITPVVFWDEFDTQEYVWLQYLLAPMQDGRFQEAQITHPVGKSVFVFAGGTSTTYSAFGAKRLDPDADHTFRLRKGPDFHSRLDAHYDVLGPNWRTVTPAGRPPSDNDPRDASDIAAPVRRGIFISAHLPAPKDQPLDIDPGLVTALLEVPRYVHGARSLEKLLSSLKPGSPHARIRRSSLPAPDVLAMHVTPLDRFAELTRYEEKVLAEVDIDPIAAAIHDNYLRVVNYAPPNPNFAATFEKLTEEE